MQVPYYGIQADPIQRAVSALRYELAGLFQVTSIGVRPGGQTITFAGHLQHDAEFSYDEIQRRFRVHGYTPMLRREQGEDVLVALPGITGKERTGNPFVNLLLFLATILTTLSAGAAMSGENLYAALSAGDQYLILRGVLAGAPFALTLMGIVGVHEIGHYVAARWHGVTATLPYFIPIPFGGLGTLGAFIALKSPMKNRKVLFDIGLAGPIAGFVVAVPLLIVGLLLSAPVPAAVRGLTLNALGQSVLVRTIVEFFTDVPPGMTLAAHPIFFAAWIGLLITGINLLPAGQLDGGHVAYALLGRRAHALALLTFAGLLVAGFWLSANWYIWAFFIMLGGLRHPPPLDDITSPGRARQFIGLLTIVLFILIITPVPFR